MTQQAVEKAVEEHHEDEGHSIAGWTSVTVMLVGVLLGALAMWFESQTMLWVGVGLLVVGAVLWPVLKLAGLGPKAR
ncbi:MAG: HGxxPAAW family protein [Pseudoclavibacter sp.]|nr:HGxxPAAW family protein [Pseudoclavibacter sp.]